MTLPLLGPGRSGTPMVYTAVLGSNKDLDWVDSRYIVGEQ